MELYHATHQLMLLRAQIRIATIETSGTMEPVRKLLFNLCHWNINTIEAQQPGEWRT